MDIVMTPKFDTKVAELLPGLVAYLHAGHIGTRPNNKHDDCVELNYQKAVAEYLETYGTLPASAQERLAMKALGDCDDLVDHDTADRERWLRKNPHALKLDKKTLHRMLDELQGPDAHKYAGSAKNAIKSEAKKN
jgi:hypothetical protein